MALTPQEVIDLVVALEKDLVGFYDDLPLRNELKPLEKICRFMSQHSAIHAQLIANYRSNAAIPQLHPDPLTTLHERLKTALREELATTDDIDQAAVRLAQTEEALAMAYARIAKHFADVADVNQSIAGRSDTLADDERSHRDYILREKAHLPKTADASSQDGKP